MPTHYARIIAAVDGSEDAGRAAAAAMHLAKGMNVPLTLLFVFPALEPHEFVSIDTVPGALHPRGAGSSQEQAEAKRQAGEKVFAAARRAIGDNGVEIDERVLSGSVVAEIMRVSKELQPAVLVVGRRGLGGFSEFMLGSVSNKLVHLGGVPVLVV